MAKISQKWLSCADVLPAFTSDYSQRLHASRVSRLLNMPQRTVARKFECLARAGLLNFERVGNNKHYFFDFRIASNISMIKIAECYKETDFLIKNSKLSLLMDELSMNHPIILFGSYAKGKAKEESDVDIVIIGRKSKKTESIMNKYPFEINAHHTTLSLLEKLLKQKQALANEIAKNHILIGKKDDIIEVFIKHFTK